MINIYIILVIISNPNHFEDHKKDFIIPLFDHRSQSFQQIPKSISSYFTHGIAFRIYIVHHVSHGSQKGVHHISPIAFAKAWSFRCLGRRWLRLMATCQRCENVKTSVSFPKMMEKQKHHQIARDLHGFTILSYWFFVGWLYILHMYIYI